VSSGVKKGLNSLSKSFDSLNTSRPASDPIRLSTKAKPSAELYLAIARNQEQKGLAGRAEENYKKALKVSPHHLESLLHYGRFLSRQQRVGEAIEVYQQAINAHPNDAKAYNHLGLCLASHNAFEQAVVAMERAVRLEPKRSLYRNNISVILVEMGNCRAAFGHLRVVHDEATAYYNLGFLLYKQGEQKAALQHFAMALRKDPKMEDARTWVARLRGGIPATGSPAVQVARRDGPVNTRTPVRQGRLTSPLPPAMPSGGPSQGTMRIPAPRMSRSWGQQAPVLHQPNGATAPVSQQQQPHLGAVVPEPGGPSNRLAGRRADGSWSGASMSQPTLVSPESRANGLAPERVNVSTSPRWGSLRTRPHSSVLAPSDSPVTTREQGTRRTNVVYPLPPVD
jgi:tetratricopeptide (TPR) repeat protein